MAPTEQHHFLDWAGWPNKATALALALIPGFAPAVLSDQALSVCAIPSASVSGTTLLLDPVKRTPVALVASPGLPLTFSQTVVLQTVWTDPDTTGLPHLRLVDVVLPEFWAQPATLVRFLKGPSAFSGAGTEVRARDWSGMPATDRRAYRLDPGLRPQLTTASLAPPGGGSLGVQGTDGSMHFTWSGVAGRVYELQTTDNLAKPFEPIQTFLPSGDGPVQFQIALPLSGSSGFYRLAEIVP